MHPYALIYVRIVWWQGCGDTNDAELRERQLAICLKCGYVGCTGPTGHAAAHASGKKHYLFLDPAKRVYQCTACDLELDCTDPELKGCVDTIEKTALFRALEPRPNDDGAG